MLHLRNKLLLLTFVLLSKIYKLILAPLVACYMRKMLEALGVGVFLCVCLCFCFKICDQRCTCHAGRFTLRHWRFHNIWTASMLRLRKCIWNFYRGLCKVVLGFACRWGFTLGCRWSFTLGRIFCVRAQCYRRTAALSASLAY